MWTKTWPLLRGSFRHMDFSEAKPEFARWEASIDPTRGERRRMYEELVAALAKEFEDALDDGAFHSFSLRW